MNEENKIMRESLDLLLLGKMNVQSKIDSVCVCGDGRERRQKKNKQEKSVLNNKYIAKCHMLDDKTFGSR